MKGLIDENCIFSCYELKSVTGIPKTTVHGILVSHLGLRNDSLKELHLQMDNARNHTAAQTQQYFEGRRYDWSNSHPIPQFRHIKLDLRGDEFDSPEELSKAIQRDSRTLFRREPYFDTSLMAK